MARPKGSKNKPKDISIIKTEEECIQEVIEAIQLIKPKKMIEGWINVYKHKGETCTNFFTGTDIYATKEGASANAQRGSLGQVFISIEDK